MQNKENIKLFIKYLSELDLCGDIRKISNEIYNELETLDVDLEEKYIMKTENLPRCVRVKIVDLIEFYYLKADDCINKYSNKEIYEFLRELNIRAKEVSLYIMSY